MQLVVQLVAVPCLPLQVEGATRGRRHSSPSPPSQLALSLLPLASLQLQLSYLSLLAPTDVFAH